MKSSSRHIFNLTVVALLGAYIATAMGYNSQARLMPLAVSFPIFLLSIWQTISDFRASHEKKEASDEKRGEPPKKQFSPGKGLGEELNVFLWVVSLFVSLFLFGFIATTFLFTFISLKIRSRFGWRSSLGVSIGSLAFLYIVMISALRVDLYQGVVILALRKMFYGY